MRELLDRSLGERLTLAEYRNDFRKRFWAIKQHDFWKLERKQTFKEPGDDSWEAFVDGDWGKAIRLIEGRRETLRAEGRRMADLGFGSYRVRVVAQPITAYLQWELHLLRLMSQCSDCVRVLNADMMRPFERAGEVPEVVTLGADITYEVLYDESGVLNGAIRFADPVLTTRCREFIQHLYDIGEDIGEFFDREVAHLPASQSVRL
jgi:hypothetical protein